MNQSFPLLSTLNSPAQLRAFPEAQLLQLAYELRSFLVDTISRTGGHLASNLGTVELTITLHCLWMPRDNQTSQHSNVLAKLARKASTDRFSL